MSHVCIVALSPHLQHLSLDVDQYCGILASSMVASALRSVCKVLQRSSKKEIRCSPTVISKA